MKFVSIKIVSAACSLTVLAACSHSPIPVTETFEYSSQKKVRSAGHWEVLSKDVAGQTLASLKPMIASGSGTFYVAAPENPTDFDLAFREFLITQFVKSGEKVLTKDQAPFKVTYSTQVVTHESPRPNFIPGFLTALAAGIFVARGITTDGQAIAATLGLTAGADYSRSTSGGRTTHTELILTTTVSGEGRYLSRTTDVYYIQEADEQLFKIKPPPPPLPATKRFEVVSK